MGYFKTEDLAVGYDGQVLIHDISIQIEKGTILTLIGPNGETVLPFRVGDLQDGGKYGHAAASISDAAGRKRFGIVANNGKVILPFEYDHIAIFSEWDAANNRWQESAMGTKDGQNFSFDISRRGE